MQILDLTAENQPKIIKETISVLKSGGMVVFPSDTVYGLLVDAKNPEAVAKLLAFKERRPGQAISIFVANKEMAEEYVVFNQNAKNVAENLLPGPFTVIAESKHQTDPRLEAENGTLGFRIPNYPLILNLVKEYGSPLTATSANLSGRPPHHEIDAFLKSLSEKKKISLNLIVDAGNLPKNKPSTVIDTTTGQLKALRVGDFLPKKANSVISNSEAETKELGRFLATKFIKKLASKPIVFLLKGNLGAGKTVFTKGFGEALEIAENIISPTFTIAYEYESKIPLKELLIKYGYDIEDITQTISESCQISLNQPVRLEHFDLYRIETVEELEEIGFFDHLTCGNLYVVEWPERLSAEILTRLKDTAEIVVIEIRYLALDQREIEWGISA